ncbi:MAG: hypothetical protein RJQ14_03545, partial [Marinoscillum sp.]
VTLPGHDPNSEVFVMGNDVPVLGTILSESEPWLFRSAIPLQPNIRYILKSGSSNYPFSIKSGKSPTPSIVGIYPAVDTIPENILKIYLEFSEPMQSINSYQYIQMKDQDGNDIRPFLELQPGLWNYDNTILTLWLDPGRIKTDLLRNKKLGQPLDSGKLYTIHVSQEWPSQAGMSLDDGLTNMYFVSGPIRDAVNLESWTLTIPRQGTKNPVSIAFDRAMDHELIKTCFSTSHPGLFAPIDRDRGIAFFPLKEWSNSTFEINILPKLEDLAGNNLICPFDRDLLYDSLQNNPKTEIKIQID